MFGKPQLQCDCESRLSALPCSKGSKMKLPTALGLPAPGSITIPLHTLCIPAVKPGAPHLPPKMSTLLQDLAGREEKKIATSIPAEAGNSERSHSRRWLGVPRHLTRSPTGRVGP